MIIKSYVEKGAVVDAIKSWVFGTSMLDRACNSERLSFDVHDLEDADVVPVEFIEELMEKRPGFFSTAGRMIIDEWHKAKSSVEHAIDKYLEESNESTS